MKQMTKKSNVFMQVLLAAAFVFVPFTLTYAATSTTTETTVTSTSSAAPVERETTTTTTKRADYDRGESRGIIGGAFHVIGTVISFPFIVVGKLLQAIF